MATQRAIAIYCRISRDSEGRSEGVAVQERHGRAYAAERWPDQPIRAFVDNDLSAAKPGLARPAYDQLVVALRRNEIDQLVCAEQSRLTRQPAEWEDLVVTLARAGISTVHCYRTGPVDIGGSKLLGRILAAVDAEEVEKLRLRIRDRHDALAAEGRPSGGSSFGYRNIVDADGRKALEVIGDQAAVLRQSAERVLAGWSLISIARDLEAQGAPTRRGGRWSSTTVKAMLTAPTAAGLRVHRGEIVGRGNWEPILDEVTWRAVRARLGSARVVHRSDGGTYTVSGRRVPGRRYLLTGGVAVCGRCGADLIAQQRRSRAGGRQPSYLCHPLRGGCSGIGILARPFEDHVADQLLARLADPEFQASLASGADDGRGELVRRIADVEGRRAELAKRWAAGEVSAGEWDAARQVLAAETTLAEGQLADLQTAALHVDAVASLRSWPVMTLDERRELVRTEITAVRVGPARPGTRRFDPGRVEIIWR